MNTKQTDGDYLEKNVVTFKFRPSYESQSDFQTSYLKVYLGAALFCGCVPQ